MPKRRSCQNRFDPRAAAIGANLFFELLGAAEIHAGGAAGFVGIHALRHLFLLKHSGVATDFGVKVALGAVAVEEIAD